MGTEEQKERVQKLIIENNYFVGGELYFIEIWALANTMQELLTLETVILRSLMLETI